MQSNDAAFDLVVISGVERDRGVRSLIRRQPVVIGRGVGVGLSLSDARVSREHAQCVASATGISFVVLPDAKRALLYRGARVEQALVPVGEEIQIGETVLRVEEPRAADHRVDARTLLTGEAEDIRAACALYALSDALRACTDRASLDRALDEWARSAPVRAVEGRLLGEGTSAPPPNNAEAHGHLLQPHADGESLVHVAHPAPPGRRLSFRYKLPPSASRIPSSASSSSPAPSSVRASARSTRSRA